MRSETFRFFFWYCQPSTGLIADVKKKNGTKNPEFRKDQPYLSNPSRLQTPSKGGGGSFFLIPENTNYTHLDIEENQYKYVELLFFQDSSSHSSPLICQ
jgi:hypothetical protein